MKKEKNKHSDKDFLWRFSIPLWGAFVAFLAFFVLYFLSLFWSRLKGVAIQSPTIAAFIAALFAFFQTLAMRKQLELIMKKPDFGDKITVGVHYREFKPVKDNYSIPEIPEKVHLELLIENHADVAALDSAIQVRFPKKDVHTVLVRRSEKNYVIDERMTWLWENYLGKPIYPNFPIGIVLNILVYKPSRKTTVEVVLLAANAPRPARFHGEIELMPGKKGELKRIE